MLPVCGIFSHKSYCCFSCSSSVIPIILTDSFPPATYSSCQKPSWRNSGLLFSVDNASMAWSQQQLLHYFPCLLSLLSQPPNRTYVTYQVVSQTIHWRVDRNNRIYLAYCHNVHSAQYLNSSAPHLCQKICPKVVLLLRTFSPQSQGGEGYKKVLQFHAHRISRCDLGKIDFVGYKDANNYETRQGRPR